MSVAQVASAPGVEPGSHEFESHPHILYSGVEQLAARQAHNLEVVGSSPTPATKKERRENRGFILPRWILCKCSVRILLIRCFESVTENFLLIGGVIARERQLYKPLLAMEKT